MLVLFHLNSPVVQCKEVSMLYKGFLCSICISKLDHLLSTYSEMSQPENLSYPTWSHSGLLWQLETPASGHPPKEFPGKQDILWPILGFLC